MNKRKIKDYLQDILEAMDAAESFSNRLFKITLSHT